MYVKFEVAIWVNFSDNLDLPVSILPIILFPNTEHQTDTHTLVELPVAAPGHGWVVAAVHLGDVVPLDIGDFVHGEVAGEGYREIVPQRQHLTTLVGQVVDQLGILAILPSQRLLQNTIKTH